MIIHFVTSSFFFFHNVKGSRCRVVRSRTSGHCLSNTCELRNHLACPGGRCRCLRRCAEEEIASTCLGPCETGWSSRGAARPHRHAQTQAQLAAGTIVAESLSVREKRQGKKLARLLAPVLKCLKFLSVFTRGGND